MFETSAALFEYTKEGEESVYMGIPPNYLFNKAIFAFSLK